MGAQDPNTRRLSSHSRKSSAKPHPTPGQDGQNIFKTSLRTPGVEKSLFPLVEGRAEAGSVWEGEGRIGPQSIRERSCRGRGSG